MVARTDGVGECSDDGLCGGVGGREGFLFSVDGRLESLDGIHLSGGVEGGRGFLGLLEVDPADHVAHGASGGGGGVEEWSKELLGDRVPEVGVLEAASLTCSGGGDQPGGHPERPLPFTTSGEGVPSGWRVPGGSGRVVHPHLPCRLAFADCVFDQVAFDAGGDDGAVPLEEGGDGKPGGLAGTGGADHSDRVLLFGGDKLLVDRTEGEPPRLRLADEEGFEVARPRPPRSPVRFAPVVRPEPPSDTSSDTEQPEDSSHSYVYGQDRSHIELGGAGEELPEQAWALSERCLGPLAGVEQRGELESCPGSETADDQGCCCDGEDCLAVGMPTLGVHAMPRSSMPLDRVFRASCWRARRRGSWQASQGHARGVGWVHASGQ